MSLRIRQIVFAARDLAATVKQIESVLGLHVAFRDPQVAEFGLENALFTIGDQFLEIVAPMRADTAAGRHLDRHGDSSYMLIFQTDDLTRDRARLDRLGVRVVWQSTYPDIRAVHLHPKDIGAAIVSIDQPTPAESWRWAGPDWRKYVSKSGAVRIHDATIGAHNPAAMSRRWSEVLGLTAPEENRPAYRTAITGGVLNFVSAEAERITEYRISVGNPQATLVAAREQHLPITDRTLTICGTRFHLTQQ